MAWVCRFCSTNNEDTDAKCLVCDKPRPPSGQTLTVERVKELGLSGDVFIPMEFAVIGVGAFQGRTDITSVTFHDGVKKILKEAFLGCKNLKQVVYTHELERIESKAFFDCTALKTEKRPRARVVAGDAYGETLVKREDPLRKPTTTSSSKPTTASPAKSTTTTSSKSSTATSSKSTTRYSSSKTTTSKHKRGYSKSARIFAGVILVGLACAIIIPFVHYLNSTYGWIGWQWIIGIIAGIILALNVYIYDKIDPYSIYTAAISTSILFIAMLGNVGLVLIFGQGYFYISLCLYLAGLIGSILSSIYSFDDYEEACGVINIILAVLNAFLFVASLTS